MRYEYAERVRECDGDGNEVWLRSVRCMSIWVLHVVQLLCLVSADDVLE